jgi:predicted DCC family thiol-disulfide oxidoreductase YuxK
MKEGGHPLLPGEKKDPKKAVLVYDGECSVCRSAVEWIRARSAPGAFEFLSFQSGDMEKGFPFLDREACKQAVHLILTDGRVLAGDRAAPEVFLRIPRYRWIARVLRFPGAGGLSRVFYRWFARRRHAIASLFHPGHKET